MQKNDSAFVITDIDFGDETPKDTPLDSRPSIAIILGAGFSVPLGYPIGNDVNKSLKKFDYKSVDISPAGELYENHNKSASLLTLYQRKLKFCERVILEYTKAHGGIFEYEEFFDFIRGKEIREEKRYIDLMESYNEYDNYEDFVNGLDNIFTQMVSRVIKDGDGEKWYDNLPNMAEDVYGYDTFLQILSEWSDNHIINVHTLNHDMVFESFSKTSYLSGKICDGFDEFGSNYYGVLPTRDNRRYNVRLERYTARYNKPIRLYKLHGSFDYILYYKTVSNNFLVPDVVIKTRYGIDIMKLMRSVDKEMRYEEYPFAYHSFFLSGKNTKVKQYDDPILFKKLHKRFQNNLKAANKLLIIGYGGKDSGINDNILKHYDYSTKSVTIIDPMPSEALKELSNTLGATLIEKSISEITKADLE